MKYIIEVDTYWVGEDNTYKTECNQEDIEDLAATLAYDNFNEYGGFRKMALNNDMDPDNLTDEQLDELSEMETDYYFYSYTVFKGTDEEFDKLDYELV